MSIPLIQEATKDAINTSIIAIKRNIERINMLLGLVDNDSPDLSGFATKQELQDAVTELQPVDTVQSGNMHAVTSNAVFNCFNFQRGVINIGAMSPNTTQTKIVTFNTPFIDNEYSICLSWVNPSNGERVIYTTDSKNTTGFTIYLRALETVDVLSIEWQAFRIPH